MSGCDFVSPFDDAFTVTMDPGFAHGVAKSTDVVAFPELFVVDDAGLTDAPDGPVKVTSAPDTAAPADVFRFAVTVVAPDAGI